MKGFIQSFYNHSPWFVQTFMLNIFAFQLHRQRFGKKLEKILRWFEETEKWSYSELEAYQEERLRLLIPHAYETVPFYNEKMKSLKLLPSDIKKISDLPKLPILTKDEIKKNLENFKSSKFRKKELIHGHTSGTTGSPLDVYWDQGMVLINNAADWRQKRWAGFKIGDPHAVILGRVIVPVQRNLPPFWRMNYVQNQLWLSAFHMSDFNLGLYVDKINKFKPKYLEGYPSTLFILANFLVKNQKRIPLKATISSAETLFPNQKSIIEEAFQCKMYDFYGLAERVVFAAECQFHEGKHLNMEYGITEIVDERGNPVKDGNPGKLIGTSLHNFGMPLIRYQTNDVATLKKIKCKCGLNYPLIESITTKWEDIILTPEGKWVSPSVLTHPFKPQKNIIESQIIQDQMNSVTIIIVKNALFCSEDEKRLIVSLRERLGENMNINVEYVERIQRENSGKFRWIISKIPKDSQFENKIAS